LLLVLGYTHGLQVWLVPASGEAQEVLSWKHGQFRTLKVLPTPDNVFGAHDNFGHLRPLVVVVDSTGPGNAYISATFTSLRSGEQVHFFFNLIEIKKCKVHYVNLNYKPKA